jgi:stage II sporulation protein M
MKKVSNKKIKKGIKPLYRETFNLLYQERLLVAIVFFFLAGFTTIGFVFPSWFSSEIQIILSEILTELEGKNLFGTILFIIQNNLKSTLIVTILGITIFMPILAITVNGYLLGAVARTSAIENGPLVLFRIIPHGIFEIPAICIAIAFGLRVGLSLLTKIRFFLAGKKSRGIVLRHLKDAMIIYLLIVVPLIVIAGVIEGSLIWFYG